MEKDRLNIAPQIDRALERAHNERVETSDEVQGNRELESRRLHPGRGPRKRSGDHDTEESRTRSSECSLGIPETLYEKALREVATSSRGT